MASVVSDKEMKEIAKDLKKRVRGLLSTYFFLILGTILLFFVVVGLVFLALWGMSETGHIYGRAVILLIGAIVVAGICVKVVLQPLFRIFKPRKNTGEEIKREDYPELFDLIDEVVDKVDCLEPKHVFLSDECNAYVNYPSMLGYLFHGKQNLTIGIPLLYGMNKTEFKSILSHEFGHFTQKTVSVNRIANLSEYICAAIAQIKEHMENAKSDSYEAKARFFARKVTEIMLEQYNKVAPINGKLSRAQEYDADKFSYEVVGTEGSLSALTKLQELSARWDRLFFPWLWDCLAQKRAPENVFGLFQRFSSKIDSISLSPMTPSMHFKAQLGEYESRLAPIESTDTHPSIFKRVKAIASYDPKETRWDDAPAFAYFPETLITKIYNKVINDIADRQSILSSETIERNIRDEELLDRMEGMTPPLLDFFYSDNIFYENEIIEQAENDDVEKAFPFTEQFANAIREYICSKNDYETLQSLNEENQIGRSYIYNGKLFNGKNVPIEEHRAYYTSKYDQARAIALQCNCWMMQHLKDNEEMNCCFKDMIGIKHMLIELDKGWNNIQTIRLIVEKNDKSTKAKEFIDYMEGALRNLVAPYFEKNIYGLTLFGWMCDNIGETGRMRKEAEKFMERAQREYDTEVYDVYRDIYTVFDEHRKFNWKTLKKNIIMPYFRNDIQ